MAIANIVDTREGGHQKRSKEGDQRKDDKETWDDFFGGLVTGKGDSGELSAGGLDCA